MQELDNSPGTPLPADTDAESMKQAVSRVHAVIESEIARDIESERIVLAGFSQGCAIQLLSMLSSKHKLGGLLCMSGWLPMIDEIHRSHNGTMHPVSDVRDRPSGLQRLKPSQPDARPAFSVNSNLLGAWQRRRYSAVSYN